MLTASSGAHLVTVGEVQTCLLPNSGPLGWDSVADLLALLPGRPVTLRQRPVALAISPVVAVGVDCAMAAVSQEKVRGIGTVATNAVLVGGRIIQSAAHAAIVPAANARRQSWSHYLSRVGLIEVVSKLTDDATATASDLTEGHFTARTGARTLDLGSISAHLLAAIRLSPLLDQDTPMLTGTTRLRWVARVADVAGPAVTFGLEDDAVRSVRVIVRDERELIAAQRFCEDLAAHDWLLTITGNAIENADRFGSAGIESVGILAPLLENLMHLWMPGAHTPRPLWPLWEQLETDPGFSRQWTALLGHTRDRMSVATVAALRGAGRQSKN